MPANDDSRGHGHSHGHAQEPPTRTRVRLCMRLRLCSLAVTERSALGLCAGRSAVAGASALVPMASACACTGTRLPQDLASNDLTLPCLIVEPNEYFGSVHAH